MKNLLCFAQQINYKVLVLDILHAAEVVRLAAGRDLVADGETLAANLTGTCHGNDSLGRWSAAGPPDGNGASQDSHSAISRKNSRETPRSGEAQETSRRASS